MQTWQNKVQYQARYLNPGKAGDIRTYHSLYWQHRGERRQMRYAVMAELSMPKFVCLTSKCAYVKVSTIFPDI